MKSIVLIVLLFCIIEASQYKEIEISYDKAQVEFKKQKSEQNITKLLQLSKILYDNSQKLKTLKEQASPKLLLSLVSQRDIDSLQVSDKLEIVAKTFHKKDESYRESLLTFAIFDKQDLVTQKVVKLYEEGGVHEERLVIELQKPSSDYRICVTFNEDKPYKECKSFKVYEPLKTSDVIVATSSDAIKSDSVFLSKSDLFVFMPYKNNSEHPLRAKIEVVDIDKQKILFSQEMQKEPTDEMKKLGLVIPAALTYEAQNLHIKISLEVKGVNPVFKEKSFSIQESQKQVSQKSVKQIPQRKEAPYVAKDKPKGKSLNIGDVKEEVSKKGTLEYRYKVRYDGSRWQVLDGAFKAYYLYNTQKLQDYGDTLEIKGKLAQEGNYKNAKVDGKLTSYYGNSQIKEISYYSNGKPIRGKTKRYFSNGSLSYVNEIIGSNEIEVFFNKSLGITKYIEIIGSNKIVILHNGSRVEFYAGSVYPVSIFSFKNNKLSNVKCYYPSMKNRLIGEKDIWGDAKVTTYFMTKSGKKCTNRLGRNDKIDRCPSNEEDQYIQAVGKSLQIVGKSRAMEKYFKHDYEHIYSVVGESMYYNAYNAILEKKLFVQSNLSTNCNNFNYASLVRSNFISFDAKVPPMTKILMFKNSHNKSFDAIQKIIMKNFAKMYYSKTSRNDSCHNEIVQFYKQMGYLNAY